MMKKRVLYYYPPNKRSIAMETLCKTVIENGHELILLTLTDKGPFHEVLEQWGVKTYTTVIPRTNSWKYYLAQGRFLISFCKKHKIDIIWSHLQEANIIALLSQRFLSAKVMAFRHHAESAFYAEYGKQFGMERNRNEARIEKLINRLANKIIVPSSGVWYGMEKYEKCDMRKVVLAPYIYDFSQYDKPQPDQVRQIREQHPAALLLIMVSRFVESKQHLPVFEIVNQLIKEGKDIKMLVMDDGPLRPLLEKFIADNQLGNHIRLVGFRQDFINFMAAADLLIHPSLTEASNNVVKELALMEKGVAVCKDVGDFNDYICPGKNGYLMDRGQLKEEIERVILDALGNPAKLRQMGSQLKIDVLKAFSDSPENRNRFLTLLETTNTNKQ